VRKILIKFSNLKDSDVAQWKSFRVCLDWRNLIPKFVIIGARGKELAIFYERSKNRVTYANAKQSFLHNI
jgi:hypothetical protein